MLLLQSQEGSQASGSSIDGHLSVCPFIAQLLMELVPKETGSNEYLQTHRHHERHERKHRKHD